MQQSSTILIIDDDPFGRDALGMILDSNGYTLVYAADGPEGIRTAAKIIPDVILLDVMMPGMNGFEVCRRLRADTILREVPVLMITALDDRASCLDGIQAGADDFITKPIDSVELLIRVQGITRLNRYRHLLNQRHRFEWVLDHADDGYFVLDENDRIVYANPSGRRYIQTSGKDEPLEGKGFVDAIQRRFQCEPASAWHQWAIRPNSGEESLFLIQPQQHSSPPIWLQVSILDQLSGGHSQRVVRTQDISTQMETQQAMWAFQSMVRHKLNTPMHTMTSCLDLLASQPVEEVDPQELNELIGWTKEAMDRLETSVSSVLRHTQAPELVHQGDFYSLLHLPELLTSIASSLDLMPVTLDIPELLTNCCISVSQSAFECVMIELFENAKKFHPRHDPRIKVVVGPSDSRASMNDLHINELHIVVIDDGIHLSPTQLERMWIPYYQGERSFTGEVPGMGLGLSLVRNLLWQLGGTCTAVNRPDAIGIVIDFALPIVQSAIET